jgi:O-antigen/teichoic acid export membrane protein
MWLILRKHESWLKLGFEVSSTQTIRDLSKPAVAFMAFPLGLALSLQGMVLVIGWGLGPTAVVIFTAYRTLTRFLVQMATILNQAIWPEISAAYGAGKMALVTQLHRRGASISFWLALGAVTAMALAGEWIIEVWTRHSFEQSTVLFLFLLITVFLNVLWQTSWVVLMATNQHQKVSLAFVATAAAGLIVSASLVPILGINGAGLILATSEVPLLYLAINNTLKLSGDDWIGYLKAVLSIPVNPKTSRTWF